MKVIKRNVNLALNALTIAAISAGFNLAQADVQYRIAFDKAADQYAVYMTPDSTPTPDLALTAQVTVKAPHTITNNSFSVENIQSNVAGASWQLHSQSNSPSESPRTNYLSFGLVITGGTSPDFGWEPGVEKKIFSFQSEAGCRSGVALIDNTDSFSQLPNSRGTNPGNQFTNLGWASANNYTGNYGGPVNCMAGEPAPELCPRAEREKARIEGGVARLEAVLARLEQKKLRLKLRIETLAARKDNLINYCP